MTESITIMGFDGKQVSANIPKLELALEQGIEKGKLDAANELMRSSQIEVPHDEGTLQNSGAVEVLPSGDIVVGYHTKYAARLHEHPEYNFQNKRKGKYLEDPIVRRAGDLGVKFVRAAQTRLF